jgi:hypothetical protein
MSRSQETAMAYADHYCCTVNEAELTILELGARMRQRMEEVSRIDAEFKNGLGALPVKAKIPYEVEVLRSRCCDLIARKRRDMASLQYMIDSITIDSVPSRQVVSHLESLVM